MSEFEFKCPQCGGSIEAEESLRGQVAECPYCGKGIVIPRMAGHATSALHPKTGPAQRERDLNALAIQRRLAQQEAEEESETAKRAAADAEARRRQLVAAGTKIAVGGVLVAALIAGVVVLRQRRGVEERSRQAAQAQQQRNEANREAQSLKELDEQRRKNEARKLEAQRKREEEKARREAELAREKEERARIREERERKLQEEIAARKAREQEETARAKKFDKARSLFSRAPADIWANLPKDRRPGAVDGTFYCMIPDDRASMYEVASAADGGMRVARISSREADEPVASDAYAREVATRGCLCVSAEGGTVYVIAPGGMENAKHPITYDMQPFELAWGAALCNLVKSVSLRTDTLDCEVSYLPSDGAPSLAAGRVGFDRYLDVFDLKNNVVNTALKNWRPPKARSVRRTVMFYDGGTVKRGANGVTLVPRNPTGRVGSSYYKLCEEARRQEGMADESQDAAREARERFCEKVKASVESGHIKVAVRSRAP